MSTSSNSTAVELREVDFNYERNHESDLLFRRFSIAILKGTVVAVMGASGSGKSTLGRIIAKMLRPQKGSVSLGKDFTRPNDMVYIDQQAMNCVFPWQRVHQNIQWPLRKLDWHRANRIERMVTLLNFIGMANVSVRLAKVFSYKLATCLQAALDSIRRAAIGRLERSAQMLNLFRLDHLADAFPANLSGGELQRLSVARSLSWKPKCAVLDESFSALDAKTKDEILISVRQLAEIEKMTLILITHNLTDALAVADRCVLVGRRPVEIVADEPVPLTFPRHDDTAAYKQTRDGLLNTIKDAIL